MKKKSPRSDQHFDGIFRAEATIIHSHALPDVLAGTVLGGSSSTIDTFFVALSLINSALGVKGIDTLVTINVKFVNSGTIVGGLGDEKGHEDSENSKEDSSDNESPSPTQILSDDTSRDETEHTTCPEGHGVSRDPRTTLVDKEHVSDEGSDDPLEASGAETLEDTCRKESFEILGGGSDDNADDDNPGRDNEDRTFSPDTSNDNNEWTSASNSEKLISGQLSDLGKIDSELGNKVDGSGCEDRTEGTS